MGGFYDGHEYFQFNSLSELFDRFFTKRYRGTTLWGHYAGKFDTLFLLDHVEKTGRRFSTNIITQGSKAICVQFRMHKHVWRVADSSAIFPGLSLEKLTSSFNTTHKKLTGSIDFKTEKVSKENEVHKKYLKNDTIGLHEVLTEYLNNPAIVKDSDKLTLASQAMAIWRRTLKAPIKTTTKNIQDFVRQSYFGGRTEIFKMRGDNLNCYDVNSLYPYVMRHSRIPTVFDSESRNLSHRLGFYDCTVSVPDTYIPVLPVKFEGKLIFPTGRFRGVFFSEEIKTALEHGARIEKIHRGAIFHESDDLFSEYIDHFYNEKKHAKKGSAQELISKLLLNSLYGKFGQREERLSLKSHEGETVFTPFHSEALYEKTGLIQIPKYHRAAHMLVHIASAITSYARIHMVKTCYKNSPEAAHYTDTDSLFTSQILNTSEELGDLKLEYSNISGIFRQPKAYYLEKDGKHLVTKAKGFSKDFINTVSKSNFHEFNFEEKRSAPCTLKSSLIRNKCYLSVVGITKKMLALYNKRRVLKNGDTEPWVIRENKIANLGVK